MGTLFKSEYSKACSQGQVPPGYRPVAPIADYDVFFAGQDDLQIATNGFCNRLPLGPAAERLNAQHVITVLHCATVQ